MPAGSRVIEKKSMDLIVNNDQSVLDAVTTRKGSSKEGILQRLFAMWFDAFVYNQIWEDPRVDLEALQLDNRSRVLSISSGGCNALNYLLESPAVVTAVDINRYHIYLLRLKLVAAKYLPEYEDFFQLFGIGKHPDNVANYTRYIAPNLDKDTRAFWEGNGFIGTLLYGDRIQFFERGGLYEHSRNGYFLRFFHRFASLLGCRTDAMLSASTTEEQELLFKENIDPFFDSLVIKTIGRLPVTMFGLGIPPQQYDELKKDLAEGGSVIDVYRERAKRLACSFPIQDNYFAWQAFGRKYDTENREALPEYLKRENFETLRDNAHLARTNTGSITDEILKMPEGTFNRFVFLDAQDWMDAETITALWRAIADRAEAGSRIIFRTAGLASPIEKSLPAALMGRFTYYEAESARLFLQDRSSIYGGFHLYVLN